MFLTGWIALFDIPRLNVGVVPAPTPPDWTRKPPAPANAADVDAYLKQVERAVAADKQSGESYAQRVAAYKQQIDARILEAKTNESDTSARLTVFEKVAKDTLGQLILTPLLTALVAYAGLKMAGDVAMAKVRGSEKQVQAQ